MQHSARAAVATLVARGPNYDSQREMILSGASSIEIKRKGLEEGMISLRKSGLQKIKDGLTTAEEVVRETVL